MVCDRWSKFENFLEDMGEAPTGTSIDRINNDGNYEPGNCRWSDQKAQSRNTRRNVKITMDGVTLTVEDWAEKLHINKQTLWYRIYAGWEQVRALTEPVKK